MAAPETQSSPTSAPFPDFCRGESLLTVAIAMQIVALCLTLAGANSDATLLPRLVLLSLYLHWIGLCGAAVLCALRQRLLQASPRVLMVACWAALVLVVTLLADAAWHVDHLRGWNLLQVGESQFSFVLRNACLAAIVAVLLLRYFWLRQQWLAQVRAESEARFQALTARIRPHFLFNALNSLAELIASRPKQAEALVEDLADVLRASFADASHLIPLAAEIDACSAYLRIEQLRLGDRLTVDWAVPEDLLATPVPRFVLQPLVENAVYHGVSRVSGGGRLRIAARRDAGLLRIEVVNPLAAGVAVTGHGIAVQNIRRRLELIYAQRARLVLAPEGDRFVALLELPLTS